MCTLGIIIHDLSIQISLQLTKGRINLITELGLKHSSNNVRLNLSQTRLF